MRALRARRPEGPWRAALDALEERARAGATSCRPWSRPSWPGPRWGRSRTGCGGVRGAPGDAGAVMRRACGAGRSGLPRARARSWLGTRRSCAPPREVALPALATRRPPRATLSTSVAALTARARLNDRIFRLRVEEVIALVFLLPTTYLTVVANVYAREVGVLGDRHPGGSRAWPWPLAVPGLPGRRAAAVAPRGLGPGAARGAALPHLHPHLHEPPRHDRLREPARRPPLPGRPRPGALRGHPLRVGGAVHHPRPHGGDELPLPELLLDRALDRAPAPAGAAALAGVPGRHHGRARLLLPRLLPVRALPGRAPAARAASTSSRGTCKATRALLEPVRAGLLAPARGQPRRLPLAARGGLAGGARLRLARTCGRGSGSSCPSPWASGSRPSTCATTTWWTSSRAGRWRPWRWRWRPASTRGGRVASSRWATRPRAGRRCGPHPSAAAKKGMAAPSSSPAGSAPTSSDRPTTG